jgi:cardiolipin synthase
MQLVEQFIYPIILLANILLAAVLIFMERRNVGATWAWLMVLLFLPVLGFLLYLVFGQKLTKRKLYKLQDGEFSHYNSAVARQMKLLENGTFRVREPAMEKHRDMIYMNVVSDGALYTENNSVRIFTEGQALFEDMLAEIERAREHVHLLYYIYRKDDLGRRMLELLTAKARQGVEVRVLYDAVGSSEISPRFFRPLTEAGGEAVPFFPSKIPFVNFRVNFRNHRKLTIIDGRIGYVGGFNVGNEYLGQDKKFGHWRDTHLKISGNAVNMLQARFFLDWNLSSPRRMQESPRYFPECGELPDGSGVQIVSSGPNSEKQQIKHALLKMIYKAQRKIYLQTPYFVPDESFLTALRMAAMSGVDVRVMIPGISDSKMVYWASHSYLGDVLKSGVRCFLYKKGFMHAKTIVVDTELASVGTANVDIRSFKLNFETNAFLYDTKLARKVEEQFLNDQAHCREITIEQYQNRPIHSRILESLNRLLSTIL